MSYGGMKLMNKVLIIKELSIKFDNFQLKDINFSIEKGTIMGFIGQNGAGKTTTLKLILNSFARNSGKITVLGRDNIEDEVFVKNNIGYVPAESYLLSNKTMEEHEKIFAKFYDNWDKEAFNHYIKKWNIPLKEKTGNLSTGTKTKGMITLALAHKPTFLILDEPTAGLDPVARLDFLDEIREFVSDGEKSVLISSHITSDLDKAADFITLIHQGEILESDSIDRIQEKYRIVKGNLDVFEEIKDNIIGSRISGDSFEGLILKENLKGKEFTLAIPNIENLLSFYIWGNK